MKLITIPRVFFDDHADRELPTPKIEKETKRTVTIDREDETFAELIADARFYADSEVDWDTKHLMPAARALLRAIEKTT